jgi:hypothetical protein
MNRGTSLKPAGRSAWLKCGALLAVGILSGIPAIAGFVSPYDPSAWTLSGPGGVDTSGAPNSITLFGCCPGSNTDYTTEAQATGDWSFSWSFSTNDPGFHNGGWLLNGAYTLVSSADGDSGSTGPIAVNAGDVIGFRVNVPSGSFEGSPALTISEFTVGVPEPSTLPLMALLGMGTAAVAGIRLRRKNRQL